MIKKINSKTDETVDVYKLAMFWCNLKREFVNYDQWMDNAREHDRICKQKDQRD